MKLYFDVEQQSDRWWELRNGIPTASEFHRIVNPTAGEGWICLAPSGETCGTTHRSKDAAEKCCAKQNKSIIIGRDHWKAHPAPIELAAGHRSYAAELVEQRICGAPKDIKRQWQNPDILRGNQMEPRILAFYRLENPEADIRKCGFITTDDGRYGCSPDGLVFGDADTLSGGLEIKAPSVATLLLWHDNPGLPAEHKVQVHGCLAVTGLPWWDFLAWHKELPEKPLLVRVTPDAFTASLKKVLPTFCDVVDHMEQGARS